MYNFSLMQGTCKQLLLSVSMVYFRCECRVILTRALTGFTCLNKREYMNDYHRRKELRRISTPQELNALLNI